MFDEMVVKISCVSNLSRTDKAKFDDTGPLKNNVVTRP